MFHKRKNVLIAVVVVLASGLVAYGLWGLRERYQATHAPTPSIAAETISYSTDEPEETPPNCDDYRVADHEPRKIEIPSIGVSGCIQKVAVDQKGAIAVPTNIHLAGWYVDSALPGQEGVSVIDGHVSGRYSDAIFTNLKNIKAGDAIRVQLGDGSWQQFKVTDKNSYSLDKMTGRLFDRLNGVNSQLTLITCGGRFDRASQTYDERIIVRAGLSR